MDIEDPANSDPGELGRLIMGMRAAYGKGENAMAFARESEGTQSNTTLASLIAYDLQAGSYIAYEREHPDMRVRWSRQMAEILNPYLCDGNSILEVGCGEATTIAGVLQQLQDKSLRPFGFDISWSRCAFGRTWLDEKGIEADLFVADLFNIPLEDSSIDVIYTAHSIEPNGGREYDAIKELLRVARRAVVLVEPIYELADAKGQARMKQHGYVRNLKQTAENLGATVSAYHLLECMYNPLNFTGLVLIEKSATNSSESTNELKWRCPLTHRPLNSGENEFYSPDTGIVYPKLRGIPLLCSSHAVVASAFETINARNQGTVKFRKPEADHD